MTCILCDAGNRSVFSSPCSDNEWKCFKDMQLMHVFQFKYICSYPEENNSSKPLHLKHCSSFLSCHWVFGTQIPLSWLCTCSDTWCFLCARRIACTQMINTRGTPHSEWSKLSNNLNMRHQPQRRDQMAKNTVFIFCAKLPHKNVPHYVTIMVQPSVLCFCFYNMERKSITQIDWRNSYKDVFHHPLE